MTESGPPSGFSSPLWLTYKAAGERLGLQATAVAARARRGNWPKRLRNDTGEAEVLVPAEALAAPAKAPQNAADPSPSPPDLQSVADAVQAAVAPLEAALEHERSQVTALREELATIRHDRDALALKVAGLEGQVQQARHGEALSTDTANALREDRDRERADRRTLQGQADALRDQLGAAHLEAAQSTGEATAERARREAAEARAQDLQRELDRLQAPRPRPWWRPW
jgi:hypothetical protein